MLYFESDLAIAKSASLTPLANYLRALHATFTKSREWFPDPEILKPNKPESEKVQLIPSTASTKWLVFLIFLDTIELIKVLATLKAAKSPFQEAD